MELSSKTFEVDGSEDFFLSFEEVFSSNERCLKELSEFQAIFDSFEKGTLMLLTLGREELLSQSEL